MASSTDHKRDWLLARLAAFEALLNNPGLDRLRDQADARTLDPVLITAPHAGYVQPVRGSTT